MNLHLELRTAENSRAARQRFGNLTQLAETSRGVWGWTFLDTLVQDVRYGLRTLASNPGFAATAVLSLALGIGANTAIFSMLNAMMLRSLPVEDPGSLPAGYETAKKLLDDGKSEDQRFLFGTSIEAMVRNRSSKLWLLNYSHPDTTKGSHPWGIFQEDTGGLQPLYIYKPAGTEDPYIAYFTASIDLNQDGTDELVVEASYRLGTAFKVVSMVGEKYQETFTSYYRGPEKR